MRLIRPLTMLGIAMTLCACGGVQPQSQDMPSVEQDDRWSSTARTPQPASVARSEGQWVERESSKKAQDRFINQNLANGDPMMSGEPIGEAVETDGPLGKSRTQYTGMQARFSDEPRTFGDPGYNGGPQAPPPGRPVAP